MESVNASTEETSKSVDDASTDTKELFEESFSEKFEALLPRIQEQWPELAKQTLEATQGSIDELVRVISLHSGKTSYKVHQQLDELFNSASYQTKNLAESLEPLEKQLEDLLDELNSQLRPKIEKPVRQRPLLAIGIAAGIGVILGLIISGGKRS